MECFHWLKKKKKVDEVVAAAGIKIAAPNLDDIVSGSPLRVLSEDGDVEAELLQELEDMTVDVDDEGLLVKADTIGSLEAVVHLLKEIDIPVRSAEIGDVTKRDVINASIAREENEEYGVIVAFNVKVHPKAQDDLDNSGVKLFAGDVIYQITEDYEAWIKERKEEIVDNKSNQQIIITEIPYEIVKSSLVKRITDLSLGKDLDGISDVRDESGMNGCEEKDRGERKQTGAENTS